LAKQSGLGANFYVGGYDLSGDTNSVGKIERAASPIEMTGIDKSAIERLAGQLTGEIDWTSYFNPTNAHPALSPLPRTDRVATYFHRAQLAVPAANMVAKQTTYNPKREESGELTLDVVALSNAWWLDWGLTLTAGKRTDTVATNGTGVDFTAPFAFGLQAYLHVFAFTGTNCTIKLQGSSDNGVGDAYADITGGAFTVVTGAHVDERIQTSRTLAVERYMRVVTTGTFSSIQFAVSATVNQADYTI
jgi:hypothetical protein